MKKYKLINTETKEETLCEKVTIDGFDYYVSDMNSKRGCFYCYRTKSLFKDEGVDINCCNADVKVIATNNPNIDVPRVVDKAELLAKNIYRDNPTDKKGVSYKYNTDINAPRKRKAFVKGYHKSQETHPFGEEDMIEFAWFMYKNLGRYSCDRTAHFNGEYLKIWKEQQPKIVYYGND